MRQTIAILMLIVCSAAVAQEQPDEQPPRRAARIDPADSLVIYQDEEVKILRSISISNMPHSPHTATMYAAIVPGLGQIYNRKYWKLPFVYGGIGALIYAIHFNGKCYDKYRRAYRDFIIRDPNNKSYASIAEKTGLSVEEIETTYATWFSNALENKKDYYRRYRDMSYFGMVGVYIVQLIDACVDAHFYNFNVDDDLSFDWSPMLMPDASGPYVGASLTITF